MFDDVLDDVLDDLMIPGWYTNQVRHQEVRQGRHGSLAFGEVWWTCGGSIFIAEYLVIYPGVNYGKLTSMWKKTYGFPMVSLWFPYDFPMVSLSKPYGFPMVSLWFLWKNPEVIKQGEPGTSFFVIAQGELEVFIKDAQGEEKRVRDLRDLKVTSVGVEDTTWRYGWKEVVGFWNFKQFPYGSINIWWSFEVSVKC